MGARQYDADIGRFLPTDPMADMFQTQGAYNYAYNSPINWKDPSGLASGIFCCVESFEMAKGWGETCC